LKCQNWMILTEVLVALVIQGVSGADSLL